MKSAAHANVTREWTYQEHTSDVDEHAHAIYLRVAPVSLTSRSRVTLVSLASVC